MRKIITFLGITPITTQYGLNHCVYSGQVFAEALRQFTVFDEMLVCATDEAKEKSWPVLEALHDQRIRCIPIPLGQTNDEMWGIFDKILEYVDEADTVIFDITHGLRSLPFLVFLFAAYLKKARKVTIEAIYYGAFDLSKRNNGIAPVIDLSGFVSMLDWLTATDQFVQTGDGRWLAGLLAPDNNVRSKTRTASDSLMMVSQAAILCQPFTLMQAAKKLSPDLDSAELELSKSAHPFGILKDQIASAFNQLYPVDESDLEKIRAEYRLIQWYFKNSLLIQAITLSREWLIDAVTVKLGAELDFLIDKRKPFEEAISGVGLVGYPYPQEPGRIFMVEDLNKYGAIIYDQWEKQDTEKLITLWRKLKKVRNVIDHAQHQSPKQIKSLTASKILEIGDEIIRDLHDLGGRWNLIEP
jgi:CRISPR-associated DxTHG motif protein